MAPKTLPHLLVEGIAAQMRRSYDRIAPTYNKPWASGKPITWHSSWETKVVREKFARRLPRGGRVLDLGCGVGVWLRRFRMDGFRVAGIDQSPRMVAFSRRRNPGTPVYCRDMRRPGFPAGSFDGIVSMYAVIHVPQADQPRVFLHMARLLKPGGLFLILVGSGAYEYVGEHHGEWLYWSGASAGESFRRLRRAGFRILWKEVLGPPDDRQLWILGQRSAVRRG